MKNVFTKEYTMNVKGIAVILLCIHHLFWKSATTPIVLPIENIYVLLTIITKVCVCIFTIISGYGLNESFKSKNIKSTTFVWQHIKKIIFSYWCVFIPMFFISFIYYIEPGGPIAVYGTGIKGFLYLILDFLGLRAIFYTPSLNNTWWYIEAILCFYLLFPIIRKCLKKNKIITFIILTIPNILAIWNESFLITTDREIFYLLPFAIGIFCSEKGIFNKLVNISISKKYKYLLISIITCLVSLLIATQIKLIGNVIYSLSIISLCIWFMSNVRFMWNPFIFIGKHSMNIFLSHSFFYIYLKPFLLFILLLKIPILKLLMLILISLMFSIIIENIKKVVKIEKIKEYDKEEINIDKEKIFK